MLPIAQETPEIPTPEAAQTAEVSQHIGEATMTLATGSEEGNTNPFAPLAEVREELFSVRSDTAIPVVERSKRLSESLDDYFDLTVQIDHQTFPSDAPTAVNEGLPRYIPDGFVDLGSSDNRRDPTLRSDDREQVWVDKREILEKYKPVLAELFRNDYSGIPLEKKELIIADRLAQEVFFTMPSYPNDVDGTIGLGSDKVRLSEISESLCRHKALVFQVLAQTMGLEMQLSKGYVDGVSHAENFLKAGDTWYLYDATQPDYEKNADGQNEWRAGRYPVDGSPPEGRPKRYTIDAPFSGKRHKYIARDDSYWYVEHPQR